MSDKCLDIQFFKVTELPSKGEPDSVYWLLTGGSVRQFVTDKQGNFISSPSITETITKLTKVASTITYANESGNTTIITFSPVAFTGDYNDLINTLVNTSELNNDGDGTNRFAYINEIPENVSDLNLDIDYGETLEFDGVTPYLLKLLDQDGDLLSSVEITPTNIKNLDSYTGFDTRYYTQAQMDDFFSGNSAISGYNKTNWDAAYGWGNHADEGYLTSFSEDDPVFTASPAASITASDIVNWNAAFGWGNHALAGYLTSFTETDPVFTASEAASITAADKTNWGTAFTNRITGMTFNTSNGNLTLTKPDTTDITENLDGRYALLSHTHSTSDITGLDAILASPGLTITNTQITNWDTAFGWGDHSLVGYLTVETDPVFSASAAFDIVAGDITNWDTAFGWGDHSVAGYELQSNKGIANGYVPLNGSGVIDQAYLPSYVDDVLEYADFASLPVTGETGKVYITLDTNEMYRWSGSVYVQVGGTTATAWGSITGTLSAQTDLQTALDGKSNTGHTHTFSDITDLASFTGFDSRYVNITGDSMTGPLGIGGSTAVGRQLTILGTGNADANGAGGLNFQTIGGGGLDIYATSTGSNPTWDIRSFASEPITISAGSTTNVTFNTDSTTSFEGWVTMTGNANTLRLIGTDTGVANTTYLSFYESDGTTREGYIGFPSAGNEHLTIFNDNSNQYLYLSGNGGDNGLVFFDGGVTRIVWHTGNDDSLVKKTTSINNATGAFDIGAGSSIGDIGYTLFSNVNPGGTLPSNYSGIFTFYGDGDGRNFALYKNNDSIGAGSFYVGLAANDGTLTWQEIWHQGSAPDLDDAWILNQRQDGKYAWLRRNSTGDAALYVTQQAVSGDIQRWYSGAGDGIEMANIDTNGNFTTAGGITANTNGVAIGNNVTMPSGGILNHNNNSSRDKIRVYSSALYTIGMQSGISFGALNSDWGMTFQMKNDNDRGFWWGKDTHSTSQGAMSLSTNGYLTLANHMRVGYGESDTTSVSTTYTIQANGTMQASNFILSSDRRLKKNIKKYTPKPIKIQWKEFDWKDKEKGHQLGLIAQEVQKNHPEFVIKDDQGLLSVKYTEVLIAKMAEKDEQIEELSGRIERLEFILKNML